jgi:GT2 family glycosyltransferase
MVAPPPVSLIVLNWNGRQFLEDCLSSLLGLDYAEFSVIVVDNASADDSVAFVQQHFPQVSVHLNKKNLGFAAGCNVILRGVVAEIAVLLNPDVVVARDWLRNLVAPMLEDRTIGIAGCKMYYPGRRHIQHAGGYIAYPQALPGHYGLNEEDNGQYDRLCDVDYIIGAALAIKRSVVDAIGLLDEGFFLFYEDADWCARARRAGYRVVYVPDATLVHVESPLTKKGSEPYLEHMHTSRWRFILKHYDLDAVLQDTVPAESLWLAGRSASERRAAARAYRTTLKNLPAIWAARERDGGSVVKPVTEDQDKHVVDRLKTLRDAAWQSSEPVVVSAPADLTEAEQPAMLAVPQQMQAKWHVQETPFVSSAPLVGPLIARFREAWNSVATKWHVRRMFQQQNEYNWLVMQRFEEIRELIDELDTRVIANDRDETALAREMGELTYAVLGLEKRLAELKARLDELSPSSGQKL